MCSNKWGKTRKPNRRQNMSETLTKEILVNAIQKSKATTISGVWKYLGHKSAISGGQSKKIKELVPNHMELLEANKNGTVVAAEKIAQPAAPAIATKVAVPAKTTTPAETKETGAGGFRAGSNYAILFAEGNKGYTTKAELLARVAKITGRPEKLVGFDYGVMGSANSKSNGGRAMIDKKTVPGKVKIVPRV